MTELLGVSAPAAAPARRRRRRRVATASVVLLAAVGTTGGWALHASRHVEVPLLTAGVALGADGRPEPLPPVPDASREQLLPGSRVLAAAGVRGEELAAAQRAFVGEPVPGAEARHRAMLDAAILDIRTLLLPDGAAVAGWPEKWRYVWPRDASMIAAALSRTGHRDEAAEVLDFLQRRQPPGGVFQARYLPDRPGPPDARGEQSDGTGWVLWALARLAADTPAGPGRTAVAERFRPMIETSTAAALRLTGRPGTLPPASQDYWEINDPRLSLGTAAPLAFGLEAAAGLQELLGEPAAAAQARDRARELRAAIDRWFGPDYPRFADEDDRDASVAFLLPPFTTHADPEVLAAWRAAATEMERPAGGLAPGAGWKDDGISWTPQTALFALTAASVGDPARATRWLDWLSAHRTEYGALPEKVLHDGRPAGPAPLTWTAAMVLLAADALAEPPA